MSGSRFAIFLTMALSLWGVLHLYVFWRLSSVGWIDSHFSRRTLMITGISLWLSYVLARLVGAWDVDVLAYPLEFLASAWMGLLFLLFAALLCVDMVTLGGVLFARWAPLLRSGAVMVAGVLAVFATVQALRAPAVSRHEIALPGLPPERDGTTVAAVSDFHLGRLLGERWLLQRVAQIDALQPDCIVAVGDVVDGNARQLERLVPALKKVSAPLGVWAVSGNHEFYEGLEQSLGILKKAGWRVLRDEAVEVIPGLVIAGVDDLTARQQLNGQGDPLGQALGMRPAGATVLLSHSPMEAGRAAELGAQLMLSGHTHAGQIWPFNFMVRLRYPLVSGRYEVDGMPVLVCRGTGTWGPRMRLWRRSEILHITLRARGGT
jgi:predicted MPP superfamily phosphohydrolase